MVQDHSTWGQLGREGSKGMLPDSSLGMSQQCGLEAKKPRATRAGLARTGGAEE